MKTFFTNERTRFITGLIISILTIYVGLALISFFFTGAADQSKIENVPLGDLLINRGSVENWTGVRGAYLSDLLMNRWFGISSFMILFFLGSVGAKLMNLNKVSLLRRFLFSASALIWGSVFFAFIFIKGYEDSFIYLGGQHGYYISEMFITNIGIPGTILLLLGSFLIIAIFTSKKTIPFLQRVFSLGWVKDRLKREGEVDVDQTEKEDNVIPRSKPVVEQPDEQPEMDEYEEFDTEAELLKAEGKENRKTVPEYKNEEVAVADDLVVTIAQGDDDPINEKTDEINTPESEDEEDAGFTVEVAAGNDETYDASALGTYDPRLDLSRYVFPTLDLLKAYDSGSMEINRDELAENQRLIKQALEDFNIKIASIKATVGPTVTLYEIVPEAGVRISKIKNLEDDIALSLSALQIRIIAPMPGKGTIGIEVPKKMLADLKDMGFKVVVSQDPVISQANKRQWEEADRLGYLVKDSTNGRSYDMPWPWGGNCGVVDFTLPAVADWWGAYQQKPIDDGIAGFWTDMGEPAWSNEEQTERLVMKHHLGMHDEIHNVYGLTWDKVVKEQFEKRNPNRRVFQMTRAAFAGLQRYTFGWTGDCGNGDDVTQGWGQMANQIPVLLSAGLGIIPFTTCDITGYCGDIEDYPAMAELYTRWIQMGAFNPLSRIHHEGNVAVEPWLFGEEAEKNAKAAIELKYRLLPYIYTYAREAHETGLPLMRPMFLEYPADMETFSTDAQFMFGSELLVAPVVKKGARNKNVYLPEGTWIDYNNKHTAYSGEQWMTVDAPLNTIPMFVKQGSIIPQMPVMNYTDEKPVYPVTFEIFPAAAGSETTFSLYEDAGTDLGYLRGEFMRTPITCQTTDTGYTLKVGTRTGEKYSLPGQRNLMFCIYTEQMPKTALLDGQKIKKTNVGKLEENRETEFTITAWCPDKKQGTCLLRLPDDGKEHIIEFVY